MTLFSAVAQLEKRKEADILVVPFWGKNKPKSAASLGSLENKLRSPLDMKDFHGKEGEIFFLYLQGEKEKRCVLLGLGEEEKVTCDSLRRAYAALAKYCQKKSFIHLNVVLPNIVELRRMQSEECVKGVCEGFLLANYTWHRKTDQEKEEETTLLKQITLVGILPKIQPFLERQELIAESVYFARDLINENADMVTPAHLAQTAQKISERFPSIKTTIFDKKRLEKDGFGLILAVGRGSSNDPVLIQMKYEGHPKSKDHTVLVGKGVTFDTGGLNLKPTGFMETMRSDMSGAAAVMGAVIASAALGLKVNVTAVVPSVENAIDGNSFKPGDSYPSYSGKTVEIGNTDAEGRLILADALTYSCLHLSPTRIIDLATLTGAIVVALGDDVAGMMTNQDVLCAKLLEASESSGEQLWRMPLYKPYKQLLKSDSADLKNIGGKAAGAITAALFLQEFVGEVPWAHLDIAGPAFGSKEHDYHPKNGVGFGVRLLVDFLQKL